MIKDSRCSVALHYLADTDEACAELKTDVARKEYALDLAKKRIFLEATGNVEERKAQAEVSAQVQSAVIAHLEATLAYEKLRAKRTTEALLIDTWRSVNANRRTGNI